MSPAGKGSPGKGGKAPAGKAKGGKGGAGVRRSLAGLLLPMPGLHPGARPREGRQHLRRPRGARRGRANRRACAPVTRAS